MKTFDTILPTVSEILAELGSDLKKLTPLVVNRDLNGRVRLIVDEKWRTESDACNTLTTVTQRMHERLEAHAFPPERAVLFEQDMGQILIGATSFPLAGIDGVQVIDRLASEGDWSSIAAIAAPVPRIAFFSIKGGVGRSTALAATAWALARDGRRVLVVDLDLESPGLSSSLLPDDRRPAFGVTDWLVEDLVDNGNELLEHMVATSPLSHDGEIYVVPAYGAEPGEYVSKLGRAWMSKVTDERRESWSERLQRLLHKLEERWQPDVVLIDSRAGIDEVASASVTDLGANPVLLFAIDGEQTWVGYRILFRHWRTTGVAREIRDRLQLVGAMIPEVNTHDYLASLRESAWNLFAEELYDEVPAGEPAMGDTWSFSEADESAPHYPWPIRWHRGFAALRSLHARLEDIDPQEIDTLFGSIVTGLENTLDGANEP
ncbi:ParA family protein [Pseudomonas lopnurensis]|uniref:ParA family protein n=1 Tax=Pseudomonas lopnurensis TaxID=1477517 RepID=UPI00187A1C03|nr:AAA family ATPase [Pseudomonas lopnurensis]MBE7373005.1 ParA family protein [Pseudomonas lopnurensis]